MLRFTITTLFATAILSSPSNAASTVVAQYLMDGNANDSSGNGYNGVNVGAVSTTNRFGAANSALGFDGSDNLVSPSPTMPVIVPNSFTFSVWFQANVPDLIYTPNINGGPVYYHNYVVFPIQGGEGSGVGLSAGTNGISLIEHGNSYIRTVLTYQSNIGNAWTNAIVTVSNNGAPMLYVNGVYVSTALDSGRAKEVAPFAATNEGIGGNGWGYFNGKIDDLTIYNGALSASEIANLYAAQSVPEPSVPFIGCLLAFYGVLNRRR